MISDSEYQQININLDAFLREVLQGSTKVVIYEREQDNIAIALAIANN